MTKRVADIAEPDIISFSGRKESGKSELANLCADYGYEKKSFATALKQLICKTTGLSSIEELNTYKDKPIGVNIGKHELDVLEKETGIDREYIKNTSGKIIELSTGRDWLQVIGTDVIRTCDPDWHVRKTLATLEPGKKYVFDDTRFRNELKALKEMGAECWYIIRTKTDNISNHLSETSLDYIMFDYNVIVNNIPLHKFKERWERYLKYPQVLRMLRERLVNGITGNKPIRSIPEEALELFFVYNQFKDMGNPMEIPLTVTPNEDHTGFIGDNGDPFITETWKLAKIIA